MMQRIPHRMGEIYLLLMYIWIPERMHLNRSYSKCLHIMNGHLKFFIIKGACTENGKYYM
ncbi:hypothetical protein FOR86_27350 [Bacillus anthracis]|nr:hypothetical protein [Bacillus anthracis]MXR60282.1 hypothetical protein [Bacillus anthracis]